MANKKVFVTGCFDMLHSGHIAFLTTAAELGDLYVCIGSDENVKQLKGRYPVTNEAERQYMINALKCIKEVRINSGFGIIDFLSELNEIKPDVFVVNEDLAIRPSTLVKYSANTPVEADFNVNFLIKNVLWLGGSYRTDDAVVAIAEFQINKKLRVGYSYDFTMSEMNNYSNGTHEVMIGYDFGYDVMKMKTPRYF